MIDHVSVGTNDLAAATALYDAALAPLGLHRLVSLPFASAYGGAHPCMWVSMPNDRQPATAGNGTHVALQAPSRAAVDAFYRAALANGATDAGGPGLRPQYTPTYYAAFVHDRDGNKIEAVCHRA